MEQERMPAIRSRKLRLSPVQGAVLRLLEEAGSEEIPVVLNTLQAQFPAYQPEELLSVAEEAVRVGQHSTVVRHP
jgi:hypothetical protein